MKLHSMWTGAALLALAMSGCGDDGGGGGDGVDASSGQNDAAIADASPTPPDADPNAPDADPNAPDADPNAPDAATCANPGTATCSLDGESLEVCSAGGQLTVEACSYGCGADPMGGDDRCNLCTPSSTECHGDSVVTCDAEGEIASETQCVLGCDSTSSPAACHMLDPTNLAPISCEAVTGTDLAVTSNMVLDTGNLSCSQVVQQLNGPDICVLRVDSLTVAAGATVRVVGPRALAVVATSGATITGALDASGDHEVPGPGAFTGGLGAGGQGVTTGDGGGGAGFGSAGGDGGGALLQGSLGGAGGLIYGNAALSPLIGGTRGGRNGVGDIDPGAGGGTIQLVSCGTITISGAVNVGGGGGLGGAGVIVDDPLEGGTGGGSGGGLLIEARAVDVSGVLAANGGGGGGGGLVGDADTPGLSGQPGADGAASATPSMGGDGPGQAGAGGAGAAGATAASSGETAAATGGAGGGGGGGIGRIRINVLPGSSANLTGTVSPAASEGAIVLQ